MQFSLFGVSAARLIMPLATAALLLTSWVPKASARFLIDPADGTMLMDGDKVTHVADFHTIAFPYFGVLGEYSASISLHGHVTFTSAPDHFIPTKLGSAQAYAVDRIAPLWTRVERHSTARVLTHTGATYFGVSWTNLIQEYSFPFVEGSAQVLFFEQDTFLQGFNFLAGDIAFSYSEVDLYGSKNLFNERLPFVIGLQSEDKQIAYAPGNGSVHDQGWYVKNTPAPFPYADNEFLLFRADGSNYISSIETIQPIPEPSTVLTLLGASLLLGWQALRRRQG